jgi:hypothetical protein
MDTTTIPVPNRTMWHTRKTIQQDAQKDRPARPQVTRNRRRTLKGYVEDFDESRMMLAGFFSILLKEGNP